MPRYFSTFPRVQYMRQNVIDIGARVRVLDSVQSDPNAFLPFTVTEDMTAEDVAYHYYGDDGYVWLVYLANNIIDPATQWPLTQRELERTVEKKYALRDTFRTDDVNLTTDSIYLTTFADLEPVRVTGSVPGGLSSSSNYFVRRQSTTQVKLSLSTTGGFENLTTRGDGGAIERRALDWSRQTSLTTNVLYCENVLDPSVRINYKTYDELEGLQRGDYRLVRAWDYEYELNESRRRIWLLNRAHAKAAASNLRRLMSE